MKEKFRTDNTDGFTDEELCEMNVELANAMMSDELGGLDDSEREKIFSERILNLF